MLAYAPPEATYNLSPLLGDVDPRGTQELTALTFESMVEGARAGELDAIMAFELWKVDPESVGELVTASEIAGVSEADILDALLKQSGLPWDIDPVRLKEAEAYHKWVIFSCPVCGDQEPETTSKGYVLTCPECKHDVFSFTNGEWVALTLWPFDEEAAMLKLNAA